MHRLSHLIIITLMNNTIIIYLETIISYSLKCLIFELLTISFSPTSLVMIMPFNTTAKNRIHGLKRIGPHNREIISIIFGSLLGDAHAEQINSGNGTRLTFFQEGKHVKYLLWLHNQLAVAGYCNSDIPIVGQRLAKGGEVIKTISFSTWTYTSFNWIHDLWYENNVKVVPKSTAEYLTPLALAIWIMDAGSKVSGGLKLSSRSFSYSDCLLLTQVLYSNFGLKSTIQSAGVPSQYIIYIWKESMDELREIVAPYIIPEMKYKVLP